MCDPGISYYQVVLVLEPVIFKSDSKLWFARLSRELIFPNITSTIISPEVCDPNHGKPPLLLVIVCSAVKNIEVGLGELKFLLIRKLFFIKGDLN